jgi:hypothetical protein
MLYAIRCSGQAPCAPNETRHPRAEGSIEMLYEGRVDLAHTTLSLSNDLIGSPLTTMNHAAGDVFFEVKMGIL